MLEPFAQAHLHGQRDHDMAVGHFGQLLEEAVTDVLGATIGAGRADSLLTTERDCHMDLAIGAVEERQAIVRVTTAQDSLEGLLGASGHRSVAGQKPSVILPQKALAMVYQDTPQRTLVGLTLSISESRLTTGFHSLTMGPAS